MKDDPTSNNDCCKLTAKQRFTTEEPDMFLYQQTRISGEGGRVKSEVEASCPVGKRASCFS